MSRKADNLARARTRYEAMVADLAAKGFFEERVWPNGCGRCGGDFHVRSVPKSFDELTGNHGAVQSHDLRWCPVCRVDRVKRWGALIQGLADEGTEIRTVPPAPSSPYARALAQEGLVRYDNTDHAWELTDAGLALLRRVDTRAA
jgi:hypothetical protein